MGVPFSIFHHMITGYCAMKRFSIALESFPLVLNLVKFPEGKISKYVLDRKIDLIFLSLLKR